MNKFYEENILLIAILQKKIETVLECGRTQNYRSSIVI